MTAKPPKLERLSDDKYLHDFRTQFCPLGEGKCDQNEPYTCTFAHYADDLRRKPVQGGKFVYSAKVCPVLSLQSCTMNCDMAHARQGEDSYHPSRFKTQLCSGKTDKVGVCSLGGIHCPNAHAKTELRVGEDGTEFSVVTSKRGQPKKTTTATTAAAKAPAASVSGSSSASGSSAAASVVASASSSSSGFADKRTPATIKRHQDYMDNFHVRKCKLKNCTSSTCFNYHARQFPRRKPELIGGKFNYMPMKCRTKHNDAKAVCAQGERCEFAHCTEEVVYHPLVFKTKICDHAGDRSGGVCKGQGIHCAKAHGESDRRDYIAPSAGGSFSSASGAASASGGYSGYADDEDEEQYDDESYASPQQRLSDFIPTESERQFFVYKYKTQVCVAAECSFCYNFHGHLERRRAPNLHNYSTLPCPRVFSKNAAGEEKWADPLRCNGGDNCTYAHTVLEVMYHPLLYKTQLCSQFLEADPSTWQCKWKNACSFAHGRADLSSKSPLLKNSEGGQSLSPTTAVESQQSAPRQIATTSLSRSISASSTDSQHSDDAFSNAEHVVVCVGLPWKTTNDAVASFLHDVNIVEVFRPLDHQGRTTGEAYVVCREAKDEEAALRRHRQHLGSRYIEVYKTTAKKLVQAQKRAAALASIQTLSEMSIEDDDDETNETEATKCEVCQLQLTSLKQLKEHISGSRHQESLLKAQRQDREHFRGRKGGQLSHDAEDSAPRESKTPAPQSAAAASAPKAATAAPAAAAPARPFDEKNFFQQLSGRVAGPAPAAGATGSTQAKPKQQAQVKRSQSSGTAAAATRQVGNGHGPGPSSALSPASSAGSPSSGGGGGFTGLSASAPYFTPAAASSSSVSLPPHLQTPSLGLGLGAGFGQASSGGGASAASRLPPGMGLAAPARSTSGPALPYGQQQGGGGLSSMSSSLAAGPVPVTRSHSLFEPTAADRDQLGKSSQPLAGISPFGSSSVLGGGSLGMFGGGLFGAGIFSPSFPAAAQVSSTSPVAELAADASDELPTPAPFPELAAVLASKAPPAKRAAAAAAGAPKKPAAGGAAPAKAAAPAASSAATAGSSAMHAFLLPVLGDAQADKYTTLFSENDLDYSSLILLKEQNLKELGIPMGTRLKILNALAALSS